MYHALNVNVCQRDSGRDSNTPVCGEASTTSLCSSVFYCSQCCHQHCQRNSSHQLSHDRLAQGFASSAHRNRENNLTIAAGTIANAPARVSLRRSKATEAISKGGIASLLSVARNDNPKEVNAFAIVTEPRLRPRRMPRSRCGEQTHRPRSQCRGSGRPTEPIDHRGRAPKTELG